MSTVLARPLQKSSGSRRPLIKGYIDIIFAVNKLGGFKDPFASGTNQKALIEVPKPILGLRGPF